MDEIKEHIVLLPKKFNRTLKCFTKKMISDNHVEEGAKKNQTRGEYARKKSFKKLIFTYKEK